MEGLHEGRMGGVKGERGRARRDSLECRIDVGAVLTWACANSALRSCVFSHAQFQAPNYPLPHPCHSPSVPFSHPPPHTHTRASLKGVDPVLIGQAVWILSVN